VKLIPGVDLAIFQFTSNQNYPVAEKGNSDQVKEGTSIYFAGYPQGTSNLYFLRSVIGRQVTSPRDGYALVYDLVGIAGGMRGGPILDEQGKLIGLHGRSMISPDTKTRACFKTR
jgi:S1-C subfamily serine protease